jgi:hypothetical protein
VNESLRIARKLEPGDFSGEDYFDEIEDVQIYPDPENEQ